ncbi:MAG: SAM-dependent methyltransferase [Sphingomicrobium sp.]
MAVGSDDHRRRLPDRHRQGPPEPGRAHRRGGEHRLSFGDDLKERIRSAGPITVEAYMAACNAHYYATRDPLGASGDFTTAPEIHQMFGEMVGACLADCWHRARQPDAIYAELGPGRGTLAADAIRLIGALEVHLVETSPALRDVQRSRVPGAVFHNRIEELPARPLLLAANEFLDALPVQQWVGDEQRLIGSSSNGLGFMANGLIVEISPARDAAVKAIATQIVRHGGAALIIDYGHAASATGDTLQSVKSHGFADPLADPGQQDLTAHVDFEAVAVVARRAGAAVTTVATQGDWLTRLGIVQRADALIRHNPDRADTINAALARLTGKDQMGDLFKVIAIHSPDWPVPAGFE